MFIFNNISSIIGHFICHSYISKNQDYQHCSHYIIKSAIYFVWYNVYEVTIVLSKYMSRKSQYHDYGLKQLQGILTSTWYLWEFVCQKRVSRAGTSINIPQNLWDVITCPCPRYLLLAHRSTYVGFHGNTNWLTHNRICIWPGNQSDASLHISSIILMDT